MKGGLRRRGTKGAGSGNHQGCSSGDYVFGGVDDVASQLIRKARVCQLPIVAGDPNQMFDAMMRRTTSAKLSEDETADLSNDLSEIRSVVEFLSEQSSNTVS
jgi:hypothetical protein